MSRHSHTVEKWPKPNFLSTTYRSSNTSLISTG